MTEKEMAARLQAWSASLEVTQLKVPVAKRIVVISPHPDDESIGPGGLLLAHKGKAEVHIVNVFDGRGGGALPDEPWESNNVYQDRLVAARRQELEKVSERLGCASLTQLNLSESLDEPTDEQIKAFREAVVSRKPQVILIPWFLDNQLDHRRVNTLLARACGDLRCMVLGFEIWGLLPPTAVFDISDYLEQKESIIALHRTQNLDINYSAYASALAKTRAFHYGDRPRRDGAVEAYFSLPCQEYCELVRTSSSAQKESETPPSILVAAG